MIRHIFMARVKDDADPADVEELLQNWRTLPKLIPEIISFTAGENLKLISDKISVVLTADFKDEADFRYYLQHPDHVAMSPLAAKVLDPDSKISVQVKLY